MSSDDSVSAVMVHEQVLMKAAASLLSTLAGGGGVDVSSRRVRSGCDGCVVHVGDETEDCARASLVVEASKLPRLGIGSPHLSQLGLYESCACEFGDAALIKSRIGHTQRHRISEPCRCVQKAETELWLVNPSLSHARSPRRLQAQMKQWCSISQVV